MTPQSSARPRAPRLLFEVAALIGGVALTSLANQQRDAKRADFAATLAVLDSAIVAASAGRSDTAVALSPRVLELANKRRDVQMAGPRLLPATLVGGAGVGLALSSLFTLCRLGFAALARRARAPRPGHSPR